MRAVIQRVAKASVSIDNEIKGEISRGMVVLLGIEEADDSTDIDWLTQKIVRLRIFDDREGVMNLSMQDINATPLIISQFTLHASTKKGNRPSYIRAARPEYAEPLYEQFVEKMRETLGKEIPTGEFGAMMQVSLINDGPVTIIIDSKNKE